MYIVMRLFCIYDRLLYGRIVLNTEIKNAILAANDETQYDESAKRLLGQKNILAHILVNTIDEFIMISGVFIVYGYV